MEKAADSDDPAWSIVDELVRQQATANDGDIVVVLIDGEATLKRFTVRVNSLIRHLLVESPQCVTVPVYSSRGSV